MKCSDVKQSYVILINCDGSSEVPLFREVSDVGKKDKQSSLFLKGTFVYKEITWKLTAFSSRLISKYFGRWTSGNASPVATNTCMKTS